MRTKIGLFGLVLVILASFGCEPVPTATPEPVGGVTKIVLSKESVGLGDPTVTYTLTLDAETGTFVLEEQDVDSVEGEVEAETLENLITQLDEVGFYEFEEDYIPADGSCCDLVYYTIAVTKDDEIYQVRGSESERPEGFLDVLASIEAVAAE